MTGPEINEPPAAAEHDLVLYDDVPERRLDPRSVRILAVLAAVVALCATLVIVVYLATRGTTQDNRSVARAAALNWVGTHCAGSSCFVARVTKNGQGVYTARIDGDVQRCLLVVVPAFLRSSSTPGGVFPTPCANLGLLHPWLTVGVAADGSPLVRGAPPHPTGFEPALLRKIATAVGATGVRWVRVTPHELATSGRKPFDLLAGGLVVTGKPELHGLQPTSSYATLSRALIARNRSLARQLQHNPSQMQSLVVGVIGRPDRLPQRARLVRYASEESGLGALARGKIDVLAVDQNDAPSILAAHRAFALAGVIRSARGMGFASADGDPLAQAVSMQLTELSTSGQVLDLYLRWFPLLRNVKVFPSAPPGQMP